MTDLLIDIEFHRWKKNKSIYLHSGMESRLPGLFM